LADQISQENGDRIREELQQQLLERIFTLMKQLHRGVSHHATLLSPPQARLAFTIAKYPDKGISVKELAKTAEITPGAITQFVDVLIMKDLVRREEDRNDRRIVRLKLTASGKSQIETLRQEFMASAARKFSVLSTEEIQQLISLLSKVGSETPVKGKLP
jgi:MarR family transcriptional regulator, organic hydroperoxide resistance regulator